MANEAATSVQTYTVLTATLRLGSIFSDTVSAALVTAAWDAASVAVATAGAATDAELLSPPDLFAFETAAVALLMLVAKTALMNLRGVSSSTFSFTLAARGC